MLYSTVNDCTTVNYLWHPRDESTIGFRVWPSEKFLNEAQKFTESINMGLSIICLLSKWSSFYLILAKCQHCGCILNLNIYQDFLMAFWGPTMERHLKPQRNGCFSMLFFEKPVPYVPSSLMACRFSLIPVHLSLFFLVGVVVFKWEVNLPQPLGRKHGRCLSSFCSACIVII